MNFEFRLLARFICKVVVESKIFEFPNKCILYKPSSMGTLYVQYENIIIIKTKLKNFGNYFDL